MNSKRLLIAGFCGVLAIASTFLSGCNKGDNKSALPSITDIDSIAAGNHTMIVITGTGFNSLADSSNCVKIFFHNKQACGSVRNDNTIDVEVPFDAGDGPVCIEFNGTRICSSGSFNYIPGNPDHNTYMRLADCPNTPVNQVAIMVATDNSILAGFNNWWKYDIDQNSWSSMPAPADKVVKAAPFTFNGKAYLFGGVSAAFSNKLQCYDPATNSWSYKSPMPSTPRADAVAFTWNNKVYIAGGTDTYTLGMNSVYNQLWQYDPIADSWQRKADMPQGAAEGCYALRIGPRFYIPSVGGYGVQQYDPSTNAWIQFASTENFPTYAVPYSDNSFELGYILGGRAGFTETGWVTRIAINPMNKLFSETWAQPPTGGYTTLSGALYAVVNNEVYYGMGYFNASGTMVQGNQLWRYKY